MLLALTRPSFQGHARRDLKHRHFLCLTMDSKQREEERKKVEWNGWMVSFIRLNCGFDSRTCWVKTALV